MSACAPWPDSLNGNLEHGYLFGAALLCLDLDHISRQNLSAVRISTSLILQKSGVSYVQWKRQTSLINTSRIGSCPAHCT